MTHYLNQQGTVRASPEECKALLITDWKRRACDGVTFQSLVGRQRWQEILEWIESLEGKMPYQIVVWCKAHRKKLPQRFEQRDQEMFKSWRELQFRMEGIERGEDRYVNAESRSTVHDWKHFTDPAELMRLMPPSVRPNQED